MKKFIIINGKDVYIIERETNLKAVMSAENTMDHSREIIVREFEDIDSSIPYNKDINSKLIECLKEAIYNTRLSTSFEDKYFIDKAKQLIKKATT